MNNQCDIDQQRNAGSPTESNMTLQHQQPVLQIQQYFGLGLSDTPTFDLPTALKVAMGSLDVDLNDELARYRQYAEAHDQASLDNQLDSDHPVTQNSGAQTNGIASEYEKYDEESGSLAIASSVSSNALAAVHQSITTVSPTDTDGAIALHTEVPDSYLESSEALLRSLDELEDDPSQHPDRSDAESSSNRWFGLMTPLGIGSLMLLVLSTATVGYIAVNPAILGFGNRETAPSDDAIAVGDADNSSRSGISTNLASSEFDELDLNSLSVIPRQSQSSEIDGLPNPEDGISDTTTDSENLQASTSTAPETSAQVGPSQVQALAPQRFAAPTTPHQTATPTPTPSPTVEPQTATPSPANTAPPPVAPPSTTTNTSEPSSAAATDQPQEGFVYVVAPFTGDRSLSQAQQAVSGAYVRNFPQGAQVQFGAFSTPERAQSLVEELNNQGIPAEVYQR